MKRTVALLILISVLGIAAGRALDIPWIGETTGFDAPDPIVWWLPAVFFSYCYALLIGVTITGIINGLKA